jgi:hypothetical protein
MRGKIGEARRDEEVTEGEEFEERTVVTGVEAAGAVTLLLLGFYSQHTATTTQI